MLLGHSGQLTMTTTGANADSMVLTSGGLDITTTGAAEKDIDVTCTMVRLISQQGLIDVKFTTGAIRYCDFSSGSLGTEFTGTGGAVYGSTSSVILLN